MNTIIQTLTKTPAKLKKDLALTGGVAFTRYPVSMSSQKMAKFKLQKKATKINLRISAPPHSHLHTMLQTPAKFKTDPAKIVGGVAFTRVDTFCDGQSDRCG